MLKAVFTFALAAAIFSPSFAHAGLSKDDPRRPENQPKKTKVATVRGNGRVASDKFKIELRRLMETYPASLRSGSMTRYYKIAPEEAARIRARMAANAKKTPVAPVKTKPKLVRTELVQFRYELEHKKIAPVAFKLLGEELPGVNERLDYSRQSQLQCGMVERELELSKDSKEKIMQDAYVTAFSRKSNRSTRTDGWKDLSRPEKIAICQALRDYATDRIAAEELAAEKAASAATTASAAPAASVSVRAAQ